MRQAHKLSLILALVTMAHAFAAPDSPACASFDCFLQELRPDAQARGVSQPVFDAAIANLSPDPRVLALANSAPEYIRPAGAYIAPRVSAEVIASARRHAERLSNTLRRVEEKYGVEREMLVSIWAIESGFGAVKGNHDVIRSLATLAHARFRGDEFFRDELLHALAILQAGDVPRARLVGSWAGAMGQPQFLPSSFLRHAADGSGDGRRDIWTNEADVLASIANYFRNFGWKRGQPWGFEVAAPEGYDFRFSRGTFAEWTARGFWRTDGGAFPTADSAYLLFPAGAGGPAFLLTDNYVVIKRYNFSDPYALAVAHLADRMRGGAAWRSKWPENERPLSRADRIALQRALAALGYSVGNVVGHLDFEQRDMIRELQAEFRMVPDGNPDGALLERVQHKVAETKKP
jgi:lytic murein transglycosylase